MPEVFVFYTQVYTIRKGLLLCEYVSLLPVSMSVCLHLLYIQNNIMMICTHLKNRPVVAIHMYSYNIIILWDTFIGSCSTLSLSGGGD